MSAVRLLFLGYVLVVLGSTAIEIVNELATGQKLLEMLDDFAMFAISVLIVTLFVRDWLAQQRAIAQLREQLAGASGHLSEIDEDSQRIVGEYRQVVQKQFDAWRLTASEQDVVLALLKGLSFREIAQLRETREKTVRQHAANVYRKARVAGRHELAAWFFEDLLGPTARSVDTSPAANTSSQQTRS